MSARPGRNRNHRSTHATPRRTAAHLHAWATTRLPAASISLHRCACGASVRLQLHPHLKYDHLDMQVLHLGRYGVWPDELLPLVQQFNREHAAVRGLA
jgi:hypothetical protein